MKRFLLSAIFLANFGLVFVYPIFTPLVLDKTSSLLPEALSLEYRLLLLGLLLASYPISWLITSPILEYLTCKGSAKRYIVMSTLGQSVGFSLSGLAIIINHFPLLICSRIITGACMGNLAIYFALLNRIEKRKVETIAIISGVAFIAAIFYGGELSTIAPDLPFWILGAVTFLFAAHSAKHFSLPENCLSSPLQHITEYFALLHTKHFPALYFSLFFFLIGWITTLQFLSAYLLEHYTQSKEQITLTFLLGGVIWLLGYIYLYPKIANKRLLLPISLIMLTLSTFGASLTNSYPLFCLFFAGASLLASLSWTKLISTLSTCAPAPMRNIPLSLNQIITLLAMIVAPIVGASLGTLDSRYIYFFASASYLIATLPKLSFIK